MAIRPYKLAAAGVYGHQNGTYPKSLSTYPKLIDDMEDNDLTEYSTNNGNWSLTNSTTLEGSYHIVESNGNFAHLRSYPGDGLPNYYPRGEALAYQGYIENTGVSFGTYFGAVNSNNTYFTRWNAGDLELVEKVGGNNSVIATVAVSLSTNKEYRFELRWDDGSHGTLGLGTTGDMLLEVYDPVDDTLVGDVQGNSTNVESNTGQNGEGIGYWRTGNAYPVRMDYWRLIQW